MKGADARMQGYVALLGLGITRSKNQMVDPMPRIKNESFKLLYEANSFFCLVFIVCGLGALTKVIFIDW